MITSALIRPSFVADTLRHHVIEVSVARPIPLRVCRLVPSSSRFGEGQSAASILPTSLQPLSQTVNTSRGLHVSLLPYVRPMAVKYPRPNSGISK